jgi:hypothetical protein
VRERDRKRERDGVPSPFEEELADVDIMATAVSWVR